MTTKTLEYSSIYNDVKKIERYWNKFKPGVDTDTSFHEKWQVMIPLFEQISEQNAAMIFIWNSKINRFVYAVDKRKVVGHDMALYLADTGVDFTVSNIHPKNLDAVLIMQQEAFNYLNLQSKHEREHTIVNYDAISKRDTGEYFHFLQQVLCIECDDNERPLFYLSYIYDVTHFKKDKTVSFIIKAPNEIKWWNFNFDTNCLETVHSLSNQEKIILSCLAKGKSSKEIATELFISPLTVDKHRRNLLNKTNCIDTTGMITYARLVGLI